MRTILPFVLVLACPLMMLLCMRGMRGHGQAQDGTTTTDEAAQLRKEIAELREEVARQKAHERLGGS